MTYTPSYSVNSPYGLTPIRGRFMGYYVHRSIPADSRDRAMRLASGRYIGRPDNLAFDVYNDDDLGWVFAVRNGLVDPVFDLKIGKVLIIPDPTYIRQLLGGA